MAIIFERKKLNDLGYYWEWNDIIVEPPDSSFRGWEVSMGGEVGWEVFNTVDDVKEYIKEKTGKSGVVLSGLKEALKGIDTLKDGEEEMALTTVQDGRYEEVGRFPSKSRPGQYYIVKLDSNTGDYTCDCPPWIYNKRKDRTCSHTDKLVGNKREVQYDKVLTAKDKAIAAMERAENTAEELRKLVRKSEEAYSARPIPYAPMPTLFSRPTKKVKPTPTSRVTKINPRRRRLILDD